MFPLKKTSYIFLFVCLSFVGYAQQKDSIQTKKITIESNYYNPLTPSKAAFYSAIVPGLGQIYNKRYWKAPIVWGALGFTTYLFIRNDDLYGRYRTAFKLRKAGLRDEFTDENGVELISLRGLENAQKVLKQNRDLSLLGTLLIYVLQIVEASVNAHLLQFNTNDNLTFKPTFTADPITYDAPKFGFSLKYSF